MVRFGYSGYDLGLRAPPILRLELTDVRGRLLGCGGGCLAIGVLGVEERGYFLGRGTLMAGGGVLLGEFR